MDLTSFFQSTLIPDMKKEEAKSLKKAGHKKRKAKRHKTCQVQAAGNNLVQQLYRTRYHRRGRISRRADRKRNPEGSQGETRLF